MNQTEARKAFHAGLPVKGDYTIKRNVKAVFDVKPKGIDFEDRGHSYFNGIGIGNLDSKSKKFASKWKKTKTFRADILIIKMGTATWTEHASRGFYHFNPHFLMRDAVLAFRVRK